jgi:hypothetical protein
MVKISFYSGHQPVAFYWIAMEDKGQVPFRLFLLVRLKIFKGPKPGIENRRLTPALVLVQVRSAIRTKPSALLFTKGTNWKGNDNLFLNCFFEIDIIALEGDKPHFLGADIDFYILGILSRFRQLPDEGQGKACVQGRVKFFKASTAGQSHNSLYPPLDFDHLPNPNKSQLDLDRRSETRLFGFGQSWENGRILLEFERQAFFFDVIQANEQSSSPLPA